MALFEKMKAIANAIRTKTGGTELMTLAEMPDAILSIEQGGGAALRQDKTNGVFDLDSNQDIVFYFSGTGFDLTMERRASRLYVSAYDAKTHEWAEYTYTSGGVRKTMYYARKKDGSATSAAATKDIVIAAADGNTDPVVDGISGLPKGDYLVVGTRTYSAIAPETVRILGVDARDD